MPGPRDNAKILRDSTSGNLTATENLTVTIEGGVHKTSPLQVAVAVPSQSGTSPTLKVTAKSLTDGKEIEVTHTENIDDATSYPFELRLPLPLSDDSSWQVDLVVGGSSPNFGATEVWLESAELAKVPAA